jgi:hypothetical protein
MTGPLAVTVGDAFYVTFNKGANFKGVCGVLGMDGIDTPESGGQYTRTVKGKAKFKLLVRSTGQNPRVDFTCISGAKSLTWNDIAFGNAMYIYVRG